MTDIDELAAIDRFMYLAATPGRSGDEAAVAAKIREMLAASGLPPEAVAFDEAHRHTRIAGNCGNMIVTLPGDEAMPRTLLAAHMDTVPICLGSQPAREGDRVVSRAATGLGADDRSGCAAIATAAVERLKRSNGRGLPPAVLVFFVQEEVGLEGARHLDRSLVGRVDRGFNFDGGNVERVINGAIGGERVDIRVAGTPAHAGAAPQKGASAVVMASIAIADLHRRGWLGRVQQPDGFGTANVGVIQGGEATNVVMPEVLLAAEARSYQPQFRQRIVQEMREAFQAAAESVKTDEGVGGRCGFQSRLDYEAFELPEGDPSVAAALAAIKAMGRSPYVDLAGGGLDANWLFQHGIPAATLGCGQQNIHTAAEWLDVPEYLDACRVATRLLCGEA